MLRWRPLGRAGPRARGREGGAAVVREVPRWRAGRARRDPVVVAAAAEAPAGEKKEEAPAAVEEKKEEAAPAAAEETAAAAETAPREAAAAAGGEDEAEAGAGRCCCGGRGGRAGEVEARDGEGTWLRPRRGLGGGRGGPCAAAPGRRRPWGWGGGNGGCWGLLGRWWAGG